MSNGEAFILPSPHDRLCKRLGKVEEYKAMCWKGEDASRMQLALLASACRS